MERLTYGPYRVTEPYAFPDDDRVEEQSEPPPPKEPFVFSLIPTKISRLPDQDSLFEEAKRVLLESQSWTRSKVHDGVTVYTQHMEIDNTLRPWYCVASEQHRSKRSFSRLWFRMSNNRIRNQPKYIPEIATVSDIKIICPSQSIWSITYHVGSPITPRVFTILQVSDVVDCIPGMQTGIIVTIPVNLNGSTENLSMLEDLGVKARLVTIEHLKEYDNGETIEWRKVICGDFGGLIPGFYVQRSMVERFASYTRRYMEWLYGPDETHDAEPEDLPAW